MTHSTDYPNEALPGFVTERQYRANLRACGQAAGDTARRIEQQRQMRQQPLAYLRGSHAVTRYQRPRRLNIAPLLLALVVAGILYQLAGPMLSRYAGMKTRKGDNFLHQIGGH